MNLVIINGRVHTMDYRDTLAEAVAGAYEEHLKGSLEVGKLGDVVILKQDPFMEAGHTLSGIEVAGTIVGGQIMYHTDDLSIG